MCQASLVIKVVRILERITFLLNKKVDYYGQISWVVAIVDIYGITSHQEIAMFDFKIFIRRSSLKDWGYKAF